MRNICVALILLLFQAALVGCQKQYSPMAVDIKSGIGRVSVDKKDTAENTDKKEDEKKLMPFDKNAGVITDTVVDVYKEPNLQSERVTQALFNQPVSVLGSREDWVQVRVVDGYTGWIKSKYMEKDIWSLSTNEYKYRIIITTKTKSIYSQEKGGATLREVLMGTELSVISKAENWYHVALPGKISGWVSESGTIQVPIDEHIPVTTAGDFVTTVSKLKGVVYLWGGISTRGVDCSGLVYICARINGVDLPRDADQQYDADVGQRIGKDTALMRQGDIVFFSTNEDLKDISHMGVIIGNGQLLHASKSKGAVVTSSLEDEYFKKRLVGAKRIFLN